MESYLKNNQSRPRIRIRSPLTIPLSVNHTYEVKLTFSNLSGKFPSLRQTMNELQRLARKLSIVTLNPALTITVDVISGTAASEAVFPTKENSATVTSTM